MTGSGHELELGAAPFAGDVVAFPAGPDSATVTSAPGDDALAERDEAAAVVLDYGPACGYHVADSGGTAPAEGEGTERAGGP